LEIASFHLCHIILRLGKLSHLPNQLCKTVGDALTTKNVVGTKHFLIYSTYYLISYIHICFHISGRIRIRIRIISTMSDKIGLDVIRFKYLNTDTESDVEYSDSNTNRSESI